MKLSRVVLFDLDGTLADTAPDLAAAINLLRVEHGMEVLAVEELRSLASKGAPGLLGKAFGVSPGQPQYEALRAAFLQNYEKALCVHTTLFPGVRELLKRLDENGYRWGVVTNKAQRYAIPLLKALQLDAEVMVGGDTTAHAKPHPLPLLHAAQLMQVDPTQCIYVGDDLRDVQAGRAANMKTVIAAYGYCDTDDSIGEWGGDVIIRDPLALLDRLAQGVL